MEQIGGGVDQIHESFRPACSIKRVQPYRDELDRSRAASESAIQDTLEIRYRVAPKLSGVDIKRHLHFGPVQRLVKEG